MLTAADTAYAIATVRALEGERPSSARLFEDPFAAFFRAAGAHAEEGTKRFLALPMFVDGIRLRTRGIDDFVREGLRAGLRQIVLVGAGFDARGLRLPEIGDTGATVFEVDLDAQLAKKRALLAAASVEVPSSVRYVACDFAAGAFEERLLDDLRAEGFREGAGALFVWEGVIAYIGTDAMQRTLRFMAAAGGPGSRVVFDFAPIAFEPDTAEARARRAGFTRFEQVSYEELWRRHLPDEPHPHASIGYLGMAFV
jgi:methyltransferase (TIGR00027 family)